MIDECDCIEEFDVDDFVGFYLINDKSFHVKRLGVETNALILAPPAGDATKWRVVAVGTTENMGFMLSAVGYREARARGWPTNRNGASCDRRTDLDRKFGTCIHMGPHNDDSDPARMVDVVVVGEYEENVDEVLKVIDALHVKQSQIPKAVHGWLSNMSKGANCARAAKFERKFDTCISIGALSDDKDPARMVDLAVVGQQEDNVDQVLAAIANIVFEKVNVTQLQVEFWMGHDDEHNRNRSLHRLEDSTDTYIEMDFAASCVHTTGKHIELRTGPELSLAAGNYIARIRHKFENDDDLQIHLRYEGMRPGTCELRRLHRVDSDEDVAKADKKLMQEIDLHEVVLDVPESLSRLLRGQSRWIEASEVVGIGVSEDTINGRLLINIAGSATTFERGLKAVIRLIASHRPHMAEDIRLRRIKGQTVDAVGFEEATQATEQDLSGCKHPFEWERLTRERWQLVGRSSAEWKRSAVPKASENSEKN
ncbi:hypothetical protein AAVH_42694, partial [Aphelenchoides avenae]